MIVEEDNMSYLYSIFLVTVMGIPLFAIDKKNDTGPSNPKNPISFRMQSELWDYHKEKDTGTEYTTYKYHDGSKSTYITYKDSSDKKN